ILGLFTLGLLACLLHFWIPLTPAAHILTLAVGCGVAVIFRRHLQFSRGVWAAAAVVFLYALSHHQSDVDFDAGLYYLQTMRWVGEHPIVAGLGNLHGRLAFNSMIFLIAGVADRGGIGWIANALVVMFALLSIFLRLRGVVMESPASGMYFWVLV